MPHWRAALAAVLVLVVATGVAAPVGARASHRWTETRTKHYTVGDVGPLTNTAGHLYLGSCGSTTGTMCFGPTAGDLFTVRIADASGRKVGGVIHITRHGGWSTTVLSRPFCGTSGPIRTVRGHLTVYVDAPGDVRDAHWYGGPGCTEIRPLGTARGATTQGATNGRVHVTFTGRGR